VGVHVTNQTSVSLLGSSIAGGALGLEANRGAVLAQGSSITGQSVAGIRAANGGVIDAGDCAGANVTGLGTGSGPNGSSVGGNTLTGFGFDDTPPWAIQNLNTTVA